MLLKYLIFKRFDFSIEEFILYFIYFFIKYLRVCFVFGNSLGVERNVEIEIWFRVFDVFYMIKIIFCVIFIFIDIL